MENLIAVLVIEMILKTVEEQGDWGDGSCSEFIGLVRQALELDLISDKEAFEYAQRALKV